jgi:murein DD-endopeptidase MepM/ murein hydrolase activator NlpD
MINEIWPTLTIGRKVMLILALIGLGYLMWPAHQNQATISGWTSNPFAAAAADAQPAAQIQSAPKIISAEAVPIGQGLAGDDVPTGNPLGLPTTVMTQGYGVGSHAPAEIWGAVDLAVDGDGNGQADPQGTLGTPVYATHAGVVSLAADTWPAGNHIWVAGKQFKTGFSHLKGFAVQDGQQVKRGDIIGYVGSTGESSGPHLDYQVWKDGVNVNPLEYGVLDAAKH